jgi:hypothetical protein
MRRGTSFHAHHALEVDIYWGWRGMKALIEGNLMPMTGYVAALGSALETMDPSRALIVPTLGGLTAIYHMLKDGTLYQDLGSNHFQNRSKGQQANRLIKRLADLGYDVALTPRTS